MYWFKKTIQNELLVVNVRVHNYVHKIFPNKIFKPDKQTVDKLKNQNSFRLIVF